MNVIDQQTGTNWVCYNADCVEVASGLLDESVGFSVFSPPFASLYTYSNSERDMGNCKNDEQFMGHLSFLIEQLYRVTKPGRLCSFHCMDLPLVKERDGVIGLRDFRGRLIRAFEHYGWIYHSGVTIWKDPVMAMQRTKAIGLLHKQIVKDSCMSRQGIPDYLITMRKPGVNPEPVAGEFDRYVGEEGTEPKTSPPGTIATHNGTRYSIEVWQRYASPVWMDIDPSKTLQRDSAREQRDERHICPLQLQVIERALTLWSNPGDVVLSPFAGIGSEGYVALKMGRKFIGIELKPSYYKQACLNLKSAERFQKELLPLADIAK